MKERSFQVRLALWATLISGAVLLSFALLAWALLKQQFVDSLDYRMMVPADRTGAQLHGRGNDGWARHFENHLQDWAPGREGASFALIVDREGDLVFSQGDSAQLEQLDLLTLTPELPKRAVLLDRMRSLAENEDLRSPGGRPLGFNPSRALNRRSMARHMHTPVEFHSLRDESGERWRVAVTRSLDRIFFLGASLDQFSTELEQVRWALLISTPLALLLTAGGGWWLAKRAISPLHNITEVAARIGSTQMSERIPRQGKEFAEFARLIDVFNEMMQRLETSFGQARRFTGDASHELKTPIALMQAEISEAMREVAPDSPEMERWTSLAEEVSRLKQITQSLLLLSQSDSGHLTVDLALLDLGDTLRELVEDAEYLCEESGLSFSCDIEGSLGVKGDRVLLMQAAQNLLSNAIKYNCEGGGVWVRARVVDENTVQVDFANTGQGIAKEQQERIFERFFRCDSAHNREKDGYGLGLNLSYEIIKAHQGSLVLLESSPEHTVFRMELSLVQAEVS